MSTKSDALKVMARAKGIIAKSQGAMEDITHAGAVVAGGAAAGWLDGAHPDKNLFGLDLGLAIGGGFVIAGVSGFLGRSSTLAMMGGAGMLAFEIGDRVRTRASEDAGVSGVRGLREAPQARAALGEGNQALAQARDALAGLRRHAA